MPIWENRDLKRAREDAKDAEQAYSAHHRDCVACIKATRSRQLQDMCTAGWKLHTARRDRRADLETERRAARQPVPGQEELFPEIAR